MRRLLLCLAFLVSNTIIAQISSDFTTDNFVEKAKKILGNDKNLPKKFDEELLVSWSNLSEEEKNRIVVLSNGMAGNNLPTRKGFDWFTKCIYYWPKHPSKSDNFSTWLDILTKFNRKNTKNLKLILETTSNLLEENTLNKSKQIKWQINSSQFLFKNTKVPTIVFEETNLSGYTAEDTTIIEKTSGVYNVLTKQFVAKNGTVRWKRTTYNPSQTYAELKSYKLNLKLSNFNADSVLFHSKYFDTPQLGRLKEKASIRAKKVATYPQFYAYDSVVKMESILSNVNYIGSFIIEGSVLRGLGNRSQKAQIEIFYDNKLVCRAKAKEFVLKENTISSKEATTAVFFDKDSITHQGLEFKYFDNKNQLVMTRVGSPTSKAPFKHSYHKIDIKSEMLNYTFSSNEIIFGSTFGNTDKSASFYSDDFFVQKLYGKYRVGETNPLTTFYKYVNENDTKAISVSGAASLLRISEDNLKPIIYNMQADGILEYHDLDKKLVFTEKLEKFVKASRQKFRTDDDRKKYAYYDYDNLSIKSNVKDQKNAVYSIKDKKFLIFGIKSFYVSYPKNVRVFPEEGKITIIKDRNILFDGAINIGKAEFYGKNFDFNYQTYIVKAPDVDRLVFRVNPLNSNSTKKEIRLTSTLEKVKCEIALDDIINRSGKNPEHRNYPKLYVNNNPVVYYSDSTIQGGKYHESNFKFEIDPFTMDSLSYYSNQSVAFKGLFTSADILPPLEEVISIQNDYSLGFVKVVEGGLLPIYNKTAYYKDTIQLTRRGLFGSGTIKYSNSTIQSNKIRFLPKAAGISDGVFVTQKDIKRNLPEIHAKGIRMVYKPENKNVEVVSVSDSSQFYLYGDEKATLKGSINLYDDKMLAKGVLDFKNAKIRSSEFDFKEHIIDADEASFSLKSQNESALAFDSENVKANIDFETRKGIFYSNEENTFIEFPDIKYICYMDEFNWFMDNDVMELKKKKQSDFDITTQLDIDESNFYSIHPNQDSLNFRAPKAIYKIGDKKLICSDVNYITIADARFYPDSGRIIVGKNAKMKELTNAKMEANFITKYHNFFNVEAKLLKKNQYKASGYYLYNTIDTAINSKVYFDKIYLNDQLQTSAEGVVKQEDAFLLSKQFAYQGKVNLAANSPGLSMAGKVSINHQCDSITKDWMSFEGQIDPKDILIPINNDNPNILSGLVFKYAKEDNFYPAFLSKKQNISDYNIINATGFLRYDSSKNEYQIANKEKLEDNNLAGDFAALRVDDCSAYADGFLNIANGSGQFKLTPIGKIEYLPNESDSGGIKLNVAIALDFPFEVAPFEKLGENVLQHPSSFPVPDINTTNFEKLIRNTIPQEDADKMVADLTLHGAAKKMPKSYNHKMALLNINLKWNEESQAYLHVGKYAIATIGKKQLYREVNGAIKIKKTKVGDVVEIYMDFGEGYYLYMNYTRGLFQVVSTNEDFNLAINEIKENKRIVKGTEGQYDIQIVTSSKAKARLFRQKLLGK